MIPETTPLSIIANVSRVVTRGVDRLTGGRVDYPLLVSVGCVEALKAFQIESRVMYGQVGWIEIMEDHQPLWAGCWGENHSFWVATQYGEVIDLNTSVAGTKRAHSMPGLKALYSPPMLWSAEVPSFYRYLSEGVAEADPIEERDQRVFQLVLREIREKCGPSHLGSTDLDELQFPNEPILCPGRRVLDDSSGTFRHFDRALSVQGLPPPPF